MIRTREITAALLLALAGCNGPAPSAVPDQVSPSARASAGPSTALEGPEAAAIASASPPALSAAAQGLRIDPDLPGATTSRIAGREDIAVAGKPACALSVQYAGAIEQPATWRGEPCGALTIRFVALEDLAAIGQDSKLDPAAREAMAALPGRKALYVEGAAASALFMPNEAGLLEKHMLAD